LQCELRDAIGAEPLPGWRANKSTPEWAKQICVRYRQTILKAILKLKPKGSVNWQNYGRCMGLFERCKTFYRHDVPRILKQDGLDKLTKRQQERFEAAAGEEEMRRYYSRVLKRPLDGKITVKDLLLPNMEQQLEAIENHRQVALFQISNQDAKISKLFYMGMSEGYSIFLNEDGDFSADDRRFDVYSGLLAFQYEVEKMRRTIPSKSRKDLRVELKKYPAFQDRGQEWFNDVCDEIKLSMKPPGAPHKFFKAAKPQI